MTDTPGRTATTTAATAATTGTPAATDAGQATSDAATASASPQSVRGGGEPRTLVEVFETAVARLARPDMLNYKRDGQWRAISSTEFLERARAVALGLRSLGLARGERALILSESSPAWTLADAGCLLSGLVDVPVYPTQAPPQVCYILNDSGARLLFIQHCAAYERIAPSIADCPALASIVFLEGETTGAPNMLTLAELEARGRALDSERPELKHELARAVEPADLATIIYTSGTTGEPKGVMLTHANFVSNMIDTSERLAFTRTDTVLSVLPLSHVFERGAMYMYIHHGAAVYYSESIEKIGDNLREVRPTVMVAVPRLYEKVYARIKERAAAEGRAKKAILEWAVEVGKRWARLTTERARVPVWLGLQHKLASRLVFTKWREGVGGRIRLLVSGGAALPDEIGYIFLGAGLPIVQGYGLTETSPVITAGSLEENRIGTVGRPIRNVEVRIAADGEIEVRGANVMRGYYNKPEATREVFTEDGWFKTGDVGALDAEGFLRITDRKKELFKTSGGKYIAPQPIEQRIKASRFVNQVVLIGNGRKFPSALIVPDWEQLRSYAQLKGLDIKTPAELCRHPRINDLMQRQIDALTADLSKYERVKKIALIEQEFTIEGGELTPTLKVKRRVIDEKYKHVINRMYED